MTDKGRDRATQLVAAEASVYTSTLLLSAQEYDQRHSANEIIVIVTDKIWSAVNCPIKVEIVPFS